MKKFYLSIVIVINITLSFQATSADIYSRTNGNWDNSNSWSLVSHNGPSCNCTPLSSDNIYIAHNIVMTGSLTNQGSLQNGLTALLHIGSDASLNGGNNYDIDIRSTATLYLCGNLTARDVIFSNGSAIMLCASASLNVFRNFENKNNSSNVTINGNIYVAGLFTNGTGGAISGAGSIQISNGPLVNNGSIMGCTGNPCNNFPCDLNGPCSTLLPIELTAFEAKVYNDYIKLSWSTASEKNNDYFILEKSLDGKIYSRLSRIKGNGNSVITQNYAYRDLYPENGNNYYRLQQFDFDGNFKSYDPISVIFKKSAFLSFHPNPSAGKALTITLNLPDDEALVEILNLSGTAYFSTIIKELVKNKTNKFVVDEIKNLPDGLYTLRVTGASGIQQEKLLISNQ